MQVKLYARYVFLKKFALECKDKSICAATAEVGVFRGEFAKDINKHFNQSKLYLFDTFDGFDDKDLKDEDEEAKNLGKGHFCNTSVELVMQKMTNASKVIVRKGYFPDTAVGLDDEKFCFVSLDADLYEPIKAGLEFFYPKMISGGVILVQDYYDEIFTGVKKAVNEFAKKHKIFFVPIGDDISVAIQKI